MPSSTPISWRVPLWARSLVYLSLIGVALWASNLSWLFRIPLFVVGAAPFLLTLLVVGMKMQAKWFDPDKFRAMGQLYKEGSSYEFAASLWWPNFVSAVRDITAFRGRVEKEGLRIAGVGDPAPNGPLWSFRCSSEPFRSQAEKTPVKMASCSLHDVLKAAPVNEITGSAISVFTFGSYT